MQTIPRYVANPLSAFVEYMDQSQRLLSLSIEGICRLEAMPKLVQALKSTDTGDYTPEEAARKEQEYKEQLERASAKAIFACKERDNDFPLLHAQALVGAWSALEAAIEDALVSMLLNESDLLRAEAFSKVRIPLAEFELLDKEERIRFLVEELGSGSDWAGNKGRGDSKQRLTWWVYLAVSIRKSRNRFGRSITCEM